MVNIVVILWIILCLYGIRYCKGGLFWEDYLSKDSTLMLKGVFAIGIILHHLSQKIEPLPRLLYYFELVGPWSVMIFFFISGYSVMFNYIFKKDYDKGFLKKRFKIIIPLYLLAILIYWGTYESIGYHHSITDVLVSFVNGSPIVIHSWYVIVILTFYILFFIQMKAFKKRYLLTVITTALLCILWIHIRPLLGYGFWWSVSVLSLPLGMLWALYKKQIDKFIHQYYWILFITFIMLFILSWKVTFNNEVLYYVFNFGDQYRQSIIFPIMFMIITMKFKTGNVILKYIGSMSLELYLFHGLFSNVLLLNTSFPETNPLLYCTLSVLLALLLSSIIHLLFRNIRKKQHLIN